MFNLLTKVGVFLRFFDINAQYSASFGHKTFSAMGNNCLKRCRICIFGANYLYNKCVSKFFFVLLRR